MRILIICYRAIGCFAERLTVGGWGTISQRYYLSVIYGNFLSIAIVGTIFPNVYAQSDMGNQSDGGICYKINNENFCFSKYGDDRKETEKLLKHQIQQNSLQILFKKYGIVFKINKELYLRYEKLLQADRTRYRLTDSYVDSFRKVTECIVKMHQFNLSPAEAYSRWLSDDRGLKITETSWRRAAYLYSLESAEAFLRAGRKEQIGMLYLNSLIPSIKLHLLMQKISEEATRSPKSVQEILQHQIQELNIVVPKSWESCKTDVITSLISLSELKDSPEMSKIAKQFLQCFHEVK